MALKQNFKNLKHLTNGKKLMGAETGRRRGGGKGRGKRSPAPFSEVNSEGDGRKVSLKAAGQK